MLDRASAVTSNLNSDRIRASIMRAEVEWFAANGMYEQAFKRQAEAIDLEKINNEFQLKWRLRIWNRRYERYSDEAKDTQDKFLRQLTQSVPGVLYRWQRSPSGREEYTYVSDGIYDVLGITPEQLMGDATTLRVHPSDELRYVREREEALHSGRDWNFEGRFTLPNGREAWLRNESRVSMAMDNYTEAYGFLRDITDEREIQEALKRTERRFREAIEAGFDGFILLDPILAENGALRDMRVAEMNARALTILILKS